MGDRFGRKNAIIDARRARTLMLAAPAGSFVGGSDADTVDGFHASATPTVSTLLALDANGDFPLSTIDGYVRGSILRGGASDWEVYAAEVDGAILIGDGTDVASTTTPTFTDVVTFQTTGIHILDTDDSHDLIIAVGSDLGADRTLTLVTGDADRIITLSGNPTLNDWFDQDVQTTASPTFVSVGLDAVLQHNGDPDTFTSFATDRWLVSCGGVTMIDAIEGAVNDVIVLGGDALIVPDDFAIAVGGIAQGRLIFDSTPAPDQIQVSTADLNFVTTAHGIIHVDGVAAGELLLADGTRYVPSGWFLAGTAAQTYTLGTVGGTITTSPGTLTVSSADAVTGVGVQTHAITSSSNPGANARILASDAFGRLQLENLGVGTGPIAAAINAEKGGVNDAIGGTATGSGRGVIGSSASGIGMSALSATGTGLQVNLTGAGTAIAIFQDNGTPVLTIQDGGQADFTEYLRHLGDPDTTMRFRADRWTLTCGGVTMIDAVGASYLNLRAGIVGINETANTKMAIGLTIDQAANDSEALNLRSSDVGAVFSDIVETGTYLTIQKVEGGSGGGLIRAFKDSGGVNSRALQLVGYLEEDVDTTKTTAARGLVEIAGLQTDGVTTENTVANGNVLALRTRRGGGALTIGFWDEDGDYYYNGALNAYDDENDALAAWDLSHVLAGEWSKIIEYGADKLEAMGVIGPVDKNGERMVSNKRTNALLMGAAGQAHFDRQDLWAEVQSLRERCQRYELALSNARLLPA